MHKGCRSFRGHEQSVAKLVSPSILTCHESVAVLASSPRAGRNNVGPDLGHLQREQIPFRFMDHLTSLNRYASPRPNLPRAVSVDPSSLISSLVDG